MTITSETDAGGAPARHAGQEEQVVVVGVDGSKSSSAALAWAAEEARLRGATLRVVQAWRLPAMGYGGYLPAWAFEDMADEISAGLHSQVTEILGTHPSARLEEHVVEGSATEVILGASKGAEMVVVGSHGRGGFSGLLLGSVSAQIAHHARCPVVIVRS